MKQLSGDACDLLLTIQKRATKTLAGQLVEDNQMCAWYELDEDDFESELRPLIDELLDGGYVKRFTDEDGRYKLMPKGENYIRNSSGVVMNTFSNISNSQIANMSSNTKQRLSVKDLDEDIKEQLDELMKALTGKDEIKARRIVDGLLVAAPSLVLQIIQIGLGMKS